MMRPQQKGGTTEHKLVAYHEMQADEIRSNCTAKNLLEDSLKTATVCIVVSSTLLTVLFKRQQ